MPAPSGQIPPPGRGGRTRLPPGELLAARPRLSLVCGGTPPPESNRRPHPYHRCAGGSRCRAGPRVTARPRRWEALLRVESLGGARLRVAQFLANLWHALLELDIAGTGHSRLPRDPLAFSMSSRELPEPVAKRPVSTTDVSICPRLGFADGRAPMPAPASSGRRRCLKRRPSGTGAVRPPSSRGSGRRSPGTWGRRRRCGRLPPTPRPRG
jgi:hypothetical protein